MAQSKYPFYITQSYHDFAGNDDCGALPCLSAFSLRAGGCQSTIEIPIKYSRTPPIPIDSPNDAKSGRRAK